MPVGGVYRRPHDLRRLNPRRRRWLGTKIAAAAPVFDPVVEIDWTGYPTAGYFDQLRYANGLVSYWRLNSGATLVDELAANTGTMNGSPPTATGALPNDTDLAVAFDGSTDDGVVDSAATVSNPFTLEGWVKVASLPGATRDLVAKRGSYLLQMNSSGKLLFSVKNDTTVTSVQSGTGVSTGSFYHVVCVYDGSTVKIYINGILDQSASHTVGVGLGLQPLRFAATPSTASPTYQSSQTATSGGVANASITCNKPASVASGDLLIAQICHRNDTLTITPPSGWTLFRSDTITDGDNRRVYLYYKVAGGSEPASYTWTLSASTNAFWVVAISRITGADATYPIADAYAVTTGSGTSKPTGSHLGSVDNNLVLALFAASNGGITWTESSGTESYDINDTVGPGNAIAASTQTQASASSLSVTGTASIAAPGYAAFVVICGSSLNRVACTLDDFTFWNVALTADQAVQHYQARLGGVGSWTEITTDVDKFTTKAGRIYELDKIGAGQSSTDVDDSLRKYDPANTSSPYSPNVVPLRKIRHRINLNGSYYPLARGFIGAYPSDYEGDVETMTISAGDGFEQLALAGVSGTLDVALSGAQINILLDRAGWSRADRAIDTGQFTMVAAILDASAKGLTEIQAVTDPLGIFFIDAAGVATYHDFAHRSTSARSITSQATFSNAADSYVMYVPELLKPALDKERIINDWTVATADGTTRTATDALSISKFFRRSSPGPLATRLDDPADAQTVATALLQQTANPAPRYSSLAVDLTDDATSAVALGLAISDRITVIHAPAESAGGPTVTKDYFIEGISWSVDIGALWRVTFQLSPCSPSSYYETLLRYGPVSYWRMATAA